MATGHIDRAEPLLREALDVARTALGSDHVQVGRFQRDLGGALMRLQRHAEAEALLLGSHAALQAELGGHQETELSITLLARLYEEWGRPERPSEYRALLVERVPSR